MITKDRFLKIFLAIGILIVIYLLYAFGFSSLEIIKMNINFFYFSLFIIFTFISFIPYSLRIMVILKSYGYNTGFFKNYTQLLAYFAMCYITPASRVGGEPLRIYMINKESNVDVKTASASVILDKFIEVLGSSLYGIIGVILIFYIINEMSIVIVFSIVIIFALILIFAIYYRSIKNLGNLLPLFKFLRLEKINSLKKFTPILYEIDNRLSDFFLNHKKAFLIAFLWYLIGGVCFVIEWKLLMLSLGINANLIQLILMINVWGITNFIPTPASLGFFEGGMSGLFLILFNNSALGLSVSLLLRVCYILVTLIGFFFGYIFYKKYSIPKSI